MREGRYQWLYEMLECFNSGEPASQPARSMLLLLLLLLTARAACLPARLPACLPARLPAPPPPHTHTHPPPLTPPPGDIHRYDELCARYAAVLNGQPALVAHERKLREKVTILCLMELISRRAPPLSPSHSLLPALGHASARECVRAAPASQPTPPTLCPPPPAPPPPPPRCSLPPDGRTVPLSLIAERTKLPSDGVEFLLMKVGG